MEMRITYAADADVIGAVVAGLTTDDLVQITGLARRASDLFPTVTSALVAAELRGRQCAGSGFAREAHGYEIVTGKMVCPECGTSQPCQGAGLRYWQKIAVHYNK